MAEALDFLQSLVNKGKSYSVVNTARSALSAILQLPSGQSFGELFLVRKFMRGVYNMKPPTPRYCETWDPQIVLNFLKSWSPAKKISLKKLTWKLVMLILLSTGQRGQIIKALNVDQMTISPGKVTFLIDNKDLKQGRPGYKADPIVFKAFPADKRICVFQYLTVYLQRTLDIRGAHKQVILTTVKPHLPASRDTVSRWVRLVLQRAGIDCTKFKAGSTRAAAVSKAAKNGAHVDEIMRAAGWTQESTFTKWYKKPVKQRKQFGDFVWSDNSKQ